MTRANANHPGKRPSGAISGPWEPGVWETSVSLASFQATSFICTKSPSGLFSHLGFRDRHGGPDFCLGRAISCLLMTDAAPPRLLRAF
jgi:hypothetical protein